MKVDISNLNSLLIDILKELGNIGAGNAATALAKLIDKKIDMEVPQVKVLDFNEVPEILGGIETPVVGIYFQIEGDLDGCIMLVFKLDSAVNLLNMLFERNREDNKLDEMDISALSEIGNILSASYVNSLSTLTNLKIKISIPSINIDMAGAIISVPAVQFGYLGDKVLFIESQLEEGKNKITGDLFLIPEMDSFEIILEKLGVVQ